jgi:uncharacterized protein (DUF1810 family)
VQTSSAPTALALLVGHPDDRKPRSGMTLFARVVPEALVFEAKLTRYFDGRPDAATLALLETPGGAT